MRTYVNKLVENEKWDLPGTNHIFNGWSLSESETKDSVYKHESRYIYKHESIYI